MRTKTNKKIETTTTQTTHDLIREVRVNYYMTAAKPFQITDPMDVAAFVRSVLTDNSREHLIAIYLDASHQVTSYATISIGTATMTTVHPREVFQRAILVGAVAVVIAHNHPSGSLTPSAEDRTVTRRLADAGQIIGIRLLDHLIVTDTEHLSIVDQ